MKIPEKYKQHVLNRSLLRKVIGFSIRLFKYIKFSLFRNVARLKGAKIGQRTVLSWSVVRTCNSRLTIGDDCIIHASYIDPRDKVIIGDNVIVNRDVEIIRLSHDIDNNTYHETISFGPLMIDQYSWLATGAKILPQVKHIASGSIIGAFAVLVKDTDEDGVYGGNPARLIRKHACRFEDLVVTSQVGGDFVHYFKSLRK